MRSPLCAVLLTFTLAWSGAAVAYDKTDTGAVDGVAVGVKSCGVYVKNRQSDPNKMEYHLGNLAITAWIAGYITSVNYIKPGKEDFFAKDLESMLLYIDKYCRDNPLKNMHQALRALFFDLNPGYQLRQ